MSVTDTTVTWRDLLDEARAASLDPQEVRWIAQRTAGFDATALQLGLNRPVEGEVVTAFRGMVERRAAGEPLQYILGAWPFRGVELKVDRRALIPRPETEVLVEAALAEANRLGAKLAVDLGTGTGAIAISLAQALGRRGLEVWATDASFRAMELACLNIYDAEVAGVVKMGYGTWFEALPDELRGRVDMVVSNPPYVAEDEMADLPDEVREWEPRQALVAGPDGLRDIRTILEQAPEWLSHPGAVLLELAPHQARRAESLARAAGFTAVSVLPDLAGRDRILKARL